MAMTPEEFKSKMEEFVKDYERYEDEAETHINMDGLMCQVLSDLGYSEGVDIFCKQDKWYN